MLNKMRIVRRFFTIISVLAITFSLGACSAQSSNIKIDDYVKNEINISGDIQQGEYEDRYSYKLPQITDNSAAAKKINERIQDDLGYLIDENLEMLDRGEIPDIIKVDWRANTYKDIISIIATTEYYPDKHYVYNYDVKHKKELNNEDILKMLGKTQAEFEEALRRGIIRNYDSSFIDLPYDNDFLKRYYDMSFILRSVTINDLNEIPVQIAFNESGLCADVELFTPAGAGFYYREVPLYFDWNKSDVKKTVKDDFFTIRLENNQVEIKLTNKTDLYNFVLVNREPLEQSSFKVNGLYSDYEDIYLGNLGYDYFPYLVLTTKNGTVEIVDLLGGVRSGIFAAFPVPGIYNVVDVRNDNVDIGDGMQFPTIVAENVDGELFDINTAAYNASEAISFDMLLDNSIASNYLTHSVATGNTYNEMYIFSFSNERQLQLSTYVYEMEHNFQYEGGMFTCLGMTDEGLLYDFNIYTPYDGDDIDSTVLMNIDYNNMLVYLKVIGGDEIFGYPNEWILFETAKG